MMSTRPCVWTELSGPPSISTCTIRGDRIWRQTASLSCLLIGNSKWTCPSPTELIGAFRTSHMVSLMPSSNYMGKIQVLHSHGTPKSNSTVTNSGDQRQKNETSCPKSWLCRPSHLGRNTIARAGLGKLGRCISVKLLYNERKKGAIMSRRPRRNHAPAFKGKWRWMP